jgi:hypothetical protein
MKQLTMLEAQEVNGGGVIKKVVAWVKKHVKLNGNGGVTISF